MCPIGRSEKLWGNSAVTEPSQIESADGFDIISTVKEVDFLCSEMKVNILHTGVRQFGGYGGKRRVSGGRTGLVVRERV